MWRLPIPTTAPLRLLPPLLLLLLLAALAPPARCDDDDDTAAPSSTSSSSSSSSSSRDSTSYTDLPGCAYAFPETNSTRERLAMTKCFPQLWAQPSLAASMRGAITWSFIQEAPYITLPPYYASRPAAAARGVSLDALLAPFPCADFAAAPRNLSGISFRIHRKLRERNRHLCVWAGPQCQFNNLLDAVHLLSRRFSFQLGVTGFLLDTAQRRCLGNFTAPLLGDSIVIIGRRRNEHYGPQLHSVLESLFGPFAPRAWLVIALTFLALGLVAFAIVRRNSHRPVCKARFWMELLFFMFGSYEPRPPCPAPAPQQHAHPPPPPCASSSSSTLGRLAAPAGKKLSDDAPLTFSNASEPRPAQQQRGSACGWRAALCGCFGGGGGGGGVAGAGARRPVPEMQQKTASVLIGASLLISLALYMLFYEQGVTRFIFEGEKNILPRNLSALTDAQAGEYVMLGNSAVEDMFKSKVNKPEHGGRIRWKQCRDDKECINMVINGTEGVQYAVMFSKMADYYLTSGNHCDKIVRFEAENLYEFSGAIWLAGGVEDKRRTAFNRDVVSMRQTGLIGQLLEDDLQSEECSNIRSYKKVAPITLLLPIALFVFPLILFAFVVGFWVPKRGTSSMCAEERGGDGGDQGDQGDVPAPEWGEFDDGGEALSSPEVSGRLPVSSMTVPSQLRVSEISDAVVVDVDVEGAAAGADEAASAPAAQAPATGGERERGID